jgi:hypothetical protein
VITAEFEGLGQGFVFCWGAVNRSPLTVVLSFFVKDLESVFDGSWSGDSKFVFQGSGESPLQTFKVEVNSTKDVFIVWAYYVVSGAQVFAFKPLSIFEISFGDISFPSPVDYAD